jgi:hypothetical protein
MYCPCVGVIPPQVGKPSRSKHNVLPRGSIQFKSLTKEDHGEWECVATNVVTSITASTRLLVIGRETANPVSPEVIFLGPMPMPISFHQP